MKIGNVRKLFYVAMILMLALAAFGSWDVSAARAQGSLGGATVRLSVDRASFGTGDRVLVKVNISNPTNSQIKILKWFTPAMGVEAPIFSITRDGKAVAYLGKLAKRMAPTDADYITLPPGGSISSEVDLTEYYDLSASGNYSVQYNVASANLYRWDQSQSTDLLTSDSVDLFVEGRAVRIIQQVNPQAVVGTNTFNGCSSSQQTDLVNARNAASTYAADDVAYFAASKQGERYVTWFGVLDATRYNLVKTHFTNVLTAVDTANPMHFDCTCTDAGVYAYVYPDSPYEIYLCGAFWSAPTTGTDSKAGTLIHEITHFTVVAGTDDYAYGQTAAKALAISNPAQAVMNADSHEYFSENNPPLEVSSGTFTDVPSTYWAYDFIERLYNAGITGGCSSSPMMYCPESSVTRAQMAVFILRGEHGSAYVPPAATGTVFGDVSTSTFAASWIEQFAAEGITGGCGSGNYCPDANVTRAQMAIFLLKGKYGSAYVPPVATGIFSDVPVGSFAADWIEQLAAEGITSGCGGGNYCPNSNVTRAEMAVFLVRAFNLP